MLKKFYIKYINAKLIVIYSIYKNIPFLLILLRRTQYLTKKTNNRCIKMFTTGSQKSVFSIQGSRRQSEKTFCFKNRQKVSMQVKNPSAFNQQFINQSSLVSKFSQKQQTSCNQIQYIGNNPPPIRKPIQTNNKTMRISHNIPKYQTQPHLKELFQLLVINQKDQTTYRYVQEYFQRNFVTFFTELINITTNQEFQHIVGQTSLVQYQDGKVIARKHKFTDQFYVLLQGIVSYNQQRIVPNTSTGTQQLQYTQVSLAQRGQLLNSQASNSPKYNPYTILTLSPCILLAFPSSQIYNLILKRVLNHKNQQISQSLCHTSLFKGVSAQKIKRLLPYFFVRNFYKFGETIYRQNQLANYAYFVLEGELDLVKEPIDINNNSIDNQNYLNNHISHSADNNAFKIVKLSKFQIFGIDQYLNKQKCSYLFTAQLSTSSLKTICISYRSLFYIQNSYPCLNQNIDFYLKRTSAMHNTICQKNQKFMQNKQNIRIVKKKKKCKNKKKKNPSSMQWWGLAQNSVGNSKYKLQLPKFQQNLEVTRSQPMFNTHNVVSNKIEQFRRKIFQQGIDAMIQDDQRNRLQATSQSFLQSPFKVNYVPKINKVKVKMLDVRPKVVDNSQKVKKKLLIYAKNLGSFCDKLNLD